MPAVPEAYAEHNLCARSYKLKSCLNKLRYIVNMKVAVFGGVIESPAWHSALLGSNLGSEISLACITSPGWTSIVPLEHKLAEAFLAVAEIQPGCA